MGLGSLPALVEQKCGTSSPSGRPMAEPRCITSKVPAAGSTICRHSRPWLGLGLGLGLGVKGWVGVGVGVGVGVTVGLGLR